MNGTAGETAVAAPSVAWRGRLDLFSLLVLLAGIVYTALAWTPSSYGVALSAIGLPNEGLVLGAPRPIRSDEWVVWTPYVQIAVENGFQRFNSLSIYGEDLRNFNGLPLLDWALPFKPQFWLFFIADPAHAFSFSHAIFIVLFLIGYHRLLIAFGFPRAWSAAGATLLFFTSYAQFWWTTTGPLLAVFPWLLLAAFHPMPALARFAALAWLIAFWLLAHLYPPVAVPLAFAGALMIVAFRPQTLAPRTLLPCLAGAAVGAGLVYLYLAGPIGVMASTVYPGSRSLGGANMAAGIYWAQFFPFAVSTDKFLDLLNLNICEVATGGSYLTALTLIFLDYRRLGALLAAGGPAARRLVWRMFWLALGFAAMSVWMMYPVPAAIGKWLLWDKVPGHRMVFAQGVLLLTMALVLLQAAGARADWRRFAVAALAVIGVWLTMKGGAGQWGRLLTHNWLDALVLPLLAAALLLLPRIGRAGDGAAAAFALILCAMAVNMVGFGRFNPIQSAVPIFERPKTPALAGLDADAAAHYRGWLTTPGHLPGAVLPGLGYKTPAHVLIAPQPEFFRPYFPEMAPADFNQVFNRYAHIQMIAEDVTPFSPYPDVIRVPARRFAVPPPVPAGARQGE